MAEDAYTLLHRAGTAAGAAVSASLEDVSAQLSSARERTRPTPADERTRSALAKLAEALPAGASVVLIDDGAWVGLVHGPVPTPLVEHAGHDAGPPADDAAGIDALRVRLDQGIRNLAVGWPAFWRLSAYPRLFAQVRKQGRCVHADGQLLVFELVTMPPAGRRA